jgi:hypothetical protein
MNDHWKRPADEDRDRHATVDEDDTVRGIAEEEADDFEEDADLDEEEEDEEGPRV